MNAETNRFSHGVVVFHTTSAAIRAEKVLRQATLEVKLVPTPRHISSDCGLAVRFNWGDQEHVVTVLESAGVEIAGVHPLPAR